MPSISGSGLGHEDEPREPLEFCPPLSRGFRAADTVLPKYTILPHDKCEVTVFTLDGYGKELHVCSGGETKVWAVTTESFFSL